MDGPDPRMVRHDALLELIGDAFGLLDIDELRHGLLESLHRVLPSDYVSLNDVGPNPADVVTVMQPEVPELVMRWAEYAHENPLLRYYLATQDGRAKRISDVCTREELHALALYREVYVPLRVEYQLAFTLPAGPDRVLAIALSRCEQDYSDAECDLANEARPFLIQAYLNAISFESLSARRAAQEAPLLAGLAAAGLTAREAEVVRVLAFGMSNQHIAAALSISARTVGKHLEHSFRKLGVSDRSSAAARVWELARAQPQGQDAAAPDARPR